jgi:hypothetical protein
LDARGDEKLFGVTLAGDSNANSPSSACPLRNTNVTTFGLSLSKSRCRQRNPKAIYFNLTEQEAVWLVSAYAKADRANMASIEIRKVV